MTEPLYREDADAREAEATVTEVNDRGGIILDRTIFYPQSGGQPGDSGTLAIAGNTIEIATTVYAEDRTTIVHVPAAGQALPAPGETAALALNWDRRHAHMRMHTALHLMCAIVPFPVTGGQISEGTGRLDFDVADASALDREELTKRLNGLVTADHPVSTRWITDDELSAQPELVRTMSVKPPSGSGRVRLVAIGANGEIDLQPCGGTHVKSTSEIDGLTVTKIEKKGRQNRRVRLAFAH